LTSSEDLNNYTWPYFSHRVALIIRCFWNHTLSLMTYIPLYWIVNISDWFEIEINPINNKSKNAKLNYNNSIGFNDDRDDMASLSANQCSPRLQSLTG